MATVVLTTQGQLYENSVLLSDAPALVLGAADQTVFNRSGGVIESTLAASPAIRIDGLGGIIVNQTGATIRSAGGNAAAVAIVGSAGDDLVDNSGTLVGTLSLGEGGDVFIARVASEGVVDLGSGNDSFLLNFGAANRASTWAPVVNGGLGTDVVSVTGIETARGANLTGFESLVVGATVTNLQDFSGYTSVSLGFNGSNNFIRSNNPLADLQLDGNQLTLGTGSVFRNLTGGANAELVELTGNGAAAGTITGAVNLGGGNDIFRLTATGTGALPTGYSAVDGGTGTDTLAISLRNGGTVDVSGFTSFEVIDAGNYTPAASNFRLVGANRILEVYADASGTLAIGQSNFGVLVPGALGTVTIESTTTIGRIGFSGPNAQPDNRATANTTLNFNIVNNGTITGDPSSGLGTVNLFYGDDFYDGRNGVQSGVIAGYAGNDTILGGVGAETLDGGFGNDSLVGGGGNDLLIGGSGADYLDGGSGVDTASYAGASGGVSVAVNAFAGFVTGADGLDTLVGIERVVGSSFGDVFDDGVGSHTMVGGAGDDIYYVDNVGDRVVEVAGEGRDVLYGRAGYQLTPGVSIEVIATPNPTDTTPINLSGNEFAQELFGNNGANVLDGNGGGDQMYGRGGDDAYYVNDARDRVFENVGEGRDVLYARAGYQLSPGVSIEVLATPNPTDTTPINISGNEFAQELFGNNGANVLDGNGGGDQMYGRGGDDAYYVNDIRDRVFEDVGGGRDVIYARAGFQLSPGVEVEVLATPNPTDTTAIFISGNEFAQELFGNAGSNILDGGGGADQMYGRGGDDVYYVDQAGDLVFEDANQGRDVVYTSASWSLGAGQQVEVIATVDAAATAAINLTGNELGQELFGNAGANVLDGRGGADVLYGRGGADTFRFSTALGAGNVDTIADFSSAQGDRIQLVAGVFTGIGASATNGVLNAGAFALSTATAEADDRIIYNPTTGALFFDADGSGAQAPVQFATLTGTPADLTAANFTIG